MRRLFLAALVIVTVGCVPAPTRMVVIGDSHSVPADAWPSAIDCMDVANRSINGAGLGTAVYFPALVDRLDDALSGVGPNDLVVVALGANDFGGRTVAQMKADKATVDAAIADRGAASKWVTSPPISAAHPYRWYEPWFSTMRARRDEWNAWLRYIGDHDIYAPLGSTLDPIEDSGDHVHMSPTARYLAGLEAKELMCPQP